MFIACSVLQAGLVSTAHAQATRPVLDTVVVEATITDLQRGMSDGRFTSLDLTRAYLARIAAYDQKGPALNTMIRLNPAAEREAAAMDAERRAGKVRGVLHGIPNSEFRSPRELGALLANSPRCQDCIVKQLFRYAAGRRETSDDSETIAQAAEAFRRSRFRFRELMITIAALTAGRADQ